MDAAFATAAYPGNTTAELRRAIEAGRDTTGKMAAEIERRERAAAGDVSVMTPGERLRHAAAARAARS